MNEQQFSPDRKNNCYIDFTGATQRMQEDIAAFEAARGEQDAVNRALDSIKRSEEGQRMANRVERGLGILLTPRDVSNGKPNCPFQEVATATVRGAVIGLGLCEDQLRGARIDPEILVPKVLGRLVVSPDEVPELYKCADKYVQLSEHGLALMDPATEEMVESWIDRATPQIDRQIYTKTGLGIFLRNANFKLQECDAYKMRHEANAGGVDWDDLLGYCQDNPGN